MEQGSLTYNKDRNHKDRCFSEGMDQSTGVPRQSTNRYCIRLTDTAPTQPDNGPCELRSSRSPVARSKSLERSTTRRADDAAAGDVSRPRWDGVSVWVPNTVASAARRRDDEGVAVQRSETLPAPPTTPTTAGNARRSRGSELIGAAANKLSRVWKNRRPTKFLRNFSTSRKTPAGDETLTVQPQGQEDQQQSMTVVVCRKCRGRTVDNSQHLGTANVSSTATAMTAPPELQLSPASRELETDSGYLVGRAATNSPNDEAISCRTLPSMSPDDVAGRERDQSRKPTEGPDGSRQPGGRGIVKVNDALRPEELLSWKLSLMDRADGGLTAARTSWVRGPSSSSSGGDEDDDADEKTSPRNSSRSRSRGAGSTVREFIFENVLERALEDSEKRSPTILRQSSVDALVGDADDVVERLFNDKLNELRRTSCDVTTDRLPPSLSAKDDDETQSKQRSVPLTLRTDNAKPTADHVPLASACAVVSDMAKESDSSLAASRRPASLPPSSVRATTDPEHEAADKGGCAIHLLPSLSPASVPYIDDDKREDDTRAPAGGAVCWRLRSKSLPPDSRLRSPCGDRVPPETHVSLTPGSRRSAKSAAEPTAKPSVLSAAVTLRRRVNHELFTRPESTSRGRHHSDVDDDDDERVVTWRQLRTAIADAAVGLADDVRATVDDREPSRRVDVTRLQRRLLRSVRTSLRTDSEPAAAAKNSANDEVRRLRTFFSSLLDCPGEDGVGGVTTIRKYVMTCRQREAGGAHDDDVNGRRRVRGGDGKELIVFVLRHGVKVDGVHVSVAGRSGLPVDTVQDDRECPAFCVVSARFHTRTGPDLVEIFNCIADTVLTRLDQTGPDQTKSADWSETRVGCFLIIKRP